MANTVSIRIPRQREFATVAGLVVGGIAARHDLTLDVLDDLQLALDSLLEHGEGDDGDVSIELSIADHTIQLSLGPVGDATVAELEQEVGETIGLRRLLDTTVDDVSLSERDGGTWVELHKGYVFAVPTG